MRRFLLLALPLLLLTIAVFHFALEALGLADGEALAVRLGGVALPPLPGWAVAGTWVLEALALTALFLMVHAPGRAAGQGSGQGSSQRSGQRSDWWLDGLLAGWIAWVFRGPLLVVTLAAAGARPGPWWRLALLWLALYSLCGLLLGALAETSWSMPRTGEPTP